MVIFAHTHTLFDIIEKLNPNLCCALMLCVLSCLIAFALCVSLNL